MGLGFGVYCRVWGLGLTVGFGVWGLGFRVRGVLVAC